MAEFRIMTLSRGWIQMRKTTLKAILVLMHAATFRVNFGYKGQFSWSQNQRKFLRL